MPTKTLAKLVALLTALTATILAIFWLDQGHMSSFWTSLGLNKGGTRINWCEERVSSLYFYGPQAKLVEKAGKWTWSQQFEKELDYLRVEKWFAKYCQIPVDKKLDSQGPQADQPLFEAQFIDGNRLSLYTDGQNTFRIRDKVFESETLRKAIKELLAFDQKME